MARSIRVKSMHYKPFGKISVAGWYPNHGRISSRRQCLHAAGWAWQHGKDGTDWFDQSAPFRWWHAQRAAASRESPQHHRQAPGGGIQLNETRAVDLDKTYASAPQAAMGLTVGTEPQLLKLFECGPNSISFSSSAFYQAYLAEPRW